MSSMGVIGTSGPSDFWMFLRFGHGRFSARRSTSRFIAFKANFLNPLDWHPLIKGRIVPNVASRSARKMIVVGSEPDASDFGPGGLDVEPDQVGLMLDGLEGLVQWLNLAADQEVAFVVDVQDQSVFGDLLRIVDRAGPIRRPAGERADRSFRC